MKAMFTRPFGTLVLACALAGGVPAAAAPRALAPPPERPAAPGQPPALPLAFVPNGGQAPAGVRYAAQVGGFGVAFTPGEARLALGETALALRFLGGRPDVEVVARERLPGTANYAQGRDPSRWHTGLPTYREVVYRGLWPGIDLAFRGEGGRLKYELHVAPGADPGRIRLAYRGALRLARAASGALEIHTPRGLLRDAAPLSYQLVDGKRVPVESSYALERGADAYGFALGRYEPSRPLVIDPGIAYATFLGGPGADRGDDVAVDAGGNAYVAGTTSAGSFELSQAFVMKIDASGSAVLYTTVVGGSHREDAMGIAVDDAGNAYLTGVTNSADFPTTAGALDRTLSGPAGTSHSFDGFVLKLGPAGDVVYSTYLGGGTNDAPAGIAVHADGSVSLAGTTSGDFPTTPGAFDTTFNRGVEDFPADAFVARLDPAGSALVYSTYLGGTGAQRFDGIEIAEAIAVDAAGSAYVTGISGSADFPTTATAFDRDNADRRDAFVTKLTPDGSAHAYSTFLGGSRLDWGNGIGVDAGGHAYVTGATDSADFATTPGAFATSLAGEQDGFVAKLSADGSALVYSTYLGGSDHDQGRDVAVDAAGNAYLIGGAGFADFPTTDDAIAVEGDSFVAKLDPTGSSPLFSSRVCATPP